MKIEYALGHRDGSVSGPWNTEEEMWNNIVPCGGTPLGRVISSKRIGFYKHLDAVNGLCYAPPIYKKLPEYSN